CDRIMALFPNSLTEEEETLQKKYAKLKKKNFYGCPQRLCQNDRNHGLVAMPKNKVDSFISWQGQSCLSGTPTQKT
ncbi:uncharacterized, partial [Tachysurus ichikawai]